MSPPSRGSSSVVPLARPPDDAPTVITRPPPAVEPGQRVGPYEVVGVAGTGGMASVLRARDVDLGREVALKMLPPAMTADPDAVARFKLEGRAAAQLDHENVARVFACGEDAGRPYIAFEFVEGETLRDAIDHRGPLPAAECASVCCEVAAGLAHAAARGVVHRDIKPSNLILTPAGRVKIVDMGLARCHRPADGDVTRSGVTLGTFDYISPEQALDPRTADARSDIYSLGCTLYHAATGRPPVPPGTAAQKLQAHQREPVLDPRVVNPAVPLGLARLLATMMAKNPARRFQTPEELLAAAARLAADLGVAADALPADARGSRVVSRLEPTPRGGLWAGLAAAVVAGLVAVGLIQSPPTPPPPSPDPPKVSTDPPGDRPRPPAAGPVTVERVEDLVRVLAQPETAVVRLAGRTFDLTAQADGLFVGGRPALTLEAADGATPTLRVQAHPPAEFDRWSRTRPGTLTVAGVAAVTLRGLRIEVVDGPAGDGLDPPAGVAVADAEAVTVDNCRFDGGAATDAAGLVVARTDGTTTLTVKRTLFGRRLGAGLAVAGPVRAALTGCGFASPQAGVRLTGAGGSLSLTSCKFLLDRGAAVELAADATGMIDAGGCVFAAPPPDPATLTAIMMGDSPPRPAVVRAPAGWPPVARFVGRPAEPNTYFGADATAADGLAVSLAAARKPDGPFQDAVEEKKASPWAGRDPLAEADGADPWRAFRVGPPAADPAGRVRVWWPEADADLPRFTFTRLDDAVRGLRPGDELHVRHDGELVLPPVVWAKAGRLTIRPFPGSRPELVPARGEVVRAVEGEVVLDGLSVRLPRLAAAVSVTGGRRATLKNCTVTLDDPAAVAVRLAADGTVTLTDTLIRGAGGVLAAADRPAELGAVNCWLAVAGPVVRSDGDVRLTLTRVTAVLGGPAFAGGKVGVTADRCLFAPATGRLTLGDRFDWTSAGPNGFADPGFRLAAVNPMATVAANPYRGTADDLGGVERADLPPAGDLGADGR